MQNLLENSVHLQSCTHCKQKLFSEKCYSVTKTKDMVVISASCGWCYYRSREVEMERNRDLHVRPPNNPRAPIAKWSRPRVFAKTARFSSLYCCIILLGPWECYGMEISLKWSNLNDHLSNYQVKGKITRRLNFQQCVKKYRPVWAAQLERSNTVRMSVKIITLRPPVIRFWMRPIFFFFLVGDEALPLNRLFMFSKHTYFSGSWNVHHFKSTRVRQALGIHPLRFLTTRLNTIFRKRSLSLPTCQSRRCFTVSVM